MIEYKLFWNIIFPYSSAFLLDKEKVCLLGWFMSMSASIIKDDAFAAAFLNASKYSSLVLKNRRDHSQHLKLLTY